MKFIDSHCHLQQSGDVADILHRATDAGVQYFICNATSPADWANVINTANNYDAVRGCIGVHPWYINKLPVNWADTMNTELLTNPALMVGEIGIDIHHPDISVQQAVFATQLSMAHKLYRPVFIHCVGAWDRILRILKLNRGNLPPVMVAHSFSGSTDIMQRLASEYNMYFSYSPMIFNKKRTGLMRSVYQTPSDRILVESDGMNPSVVVDVVGRISEIKSVANDKMADIIYSNTIGIL